MNQLVKILGPAHRTFLQKLSADMLLFGKTCFPNMFQVKSPEFHHELAALFMDKSIKQLNVIAPRGHAKSSLAACIWVLHHLFFEDGPKFIVLVSKTEGHTIRLLQTIKNALDYSPHIRKYLGYWGEHSAKVWTNSEIQLKDGSAILCRGTGQMVVGLKHGDQRPTLIILDDPEDMNNTKTPEAMEFNLRWLLQSLKPCLDPTRGRIAVIGTPQHQRCIVEVLDRAKGWKSVRYKAVLDEAAGVVIWPEWMSFAKLMEEKEALASMGRVSAFYREYQCQVIGDEDQLFRAEDFRYYDGYVKDSFLHITELNHAKLEKEEIVAISLFMGVDPASSILQSADYSTIVVAAVDEKGRRFVIEYFRKRVTPLALAEEIIRWFDRYHPVKTRIESTGYQEMLREYVRSKRAIPGLEIKEMPRNSKSRRLEALQPYFAQHLMHLKRGQTALEDELLMYPRGSHDDLLDGLFYASKHSYTPYHRYIESKNDLRYFPDLQRPQVIDWITGQPKVA